MLQIWHKLNSSKPTWALPEPDGPPTTGFAGVDYYKMKVALVRLQVMTALPYESLGGAKERVRSGIAARVLSLKLPVIVLQKNLSRDRGCRCCQRCGSTKCASGILPRLRDQLKNPNYPAGLEPINRRQAPVLRNVERFAVFVFDREPRSVIVRLVRVVTNRLDTVARNESIRRCPLTTL
jgi:hypothetical protein